MPRKAAKLPGAVLRAFEHADAIIHAGDMSYIGVLRALEALAPVAAVAGNTTRRIYKSCWARKS
jgi:predicted phosphodiesterase